jgi:formate hydrogenlyase subunit 6/NADH:ubiquinone oxidoreductase subunit I
MRIHELPLLDDSRCTGCGDCVVVCPVFCLEMAGPLPWLPRPLDCTSCGLCAEICPADALEMAPLEAA